MDKFKQITEAEKIGYFAILKFKGKEPSPIVNIYEIDGEIAILTKDKMTHLCMDNETWKECLKDIEITGFLYAGELAGNEEIPEDGQKFKVKETGEILNRVRTISTSKSRLWFTNICRSYDKSEIEPYFN